MRRLCECVDPVNASIVTVRSQSATYSVHVEAGARKTVPALVAAASGGRCALITDSTVDGMWGKAMATSLSESGLDVTKLVFPAGEIHKTRKTWSALTDGMLEAGLGRDGCVVALGGGVVGDVAGFVAATYMRGIPLIQVPTTTLSMIDASVGGKTGVDHKAGKNLVGAFHPPAAVVADPEFLSTLSPELRGQGYAEAVKHGFILDLEHAEEIREHAASLLAGESGATAPIILRSVGLKASVVEADEFESGRREILNFGHTVAHALELAEDFQLPHGHAVAMGMMIESRIGEHLGLTEVGTTRTLSLALESLGLPTAYSGGASAKTIAAFARHDKKNREGRVRMVFLERAGAVLGGDLWATALDGAELESLLREVL